MSSDHDPNAAFSLASIEVHPSRNLLVTESAEIRVEPRLMDVLGMLAERPAEVVARDALIERLWVSDYGADEGLTRAVSRLRKVLRDAGVPGEAIETIKKRGYRLATPVEPIANAAALPGAPLSTSRSGFALWLGIAGALLVALLLWHFRAPAPVDSAESPTLAVLPFQTLSDDTNDRYVGTGVAEELLNKLAGITDLRVIARTSAFADDPDDDNIALAERLGADHLLTGSVRRDGERMRITAQLRRVDDLVSLWSETYELDTTALFDIEDTIVLEIAQTLQVRLGVGAATDRADGAGINAAAYDQYLQGLRLWGDRMRRNTNRSDALAAFERAVSFDPNFADAWAGLGTVAAFSVGSPQSRDQVAFSKKTEAALLTALSLDPDNVKANAALAVFHSTQRIDIEKADLYLRKAQSIAPNAASTHYASTWVYRLLGNAEAALAAIDRTIALDPLNPALPGSRAAILIELGRFDEAMAIFDACFEVRCMGEGFIAFGSTAAILSEDAEHLNRWRPRMAAFAEILSTQSDEQKPNVAKVLPAFMAVGFGSENAEQQIEGFRQLMAEELITDSIGSWGPTLAPFLPVETVMDALHLAYERGELFGAVFTLTPLYGVNDWPEEVLRHPRYRELWERPGMPELAARWRLQESTAGLPRE
ncbi:MAG: winged helix-turn-helix domain-containing protein [Pseudomonadota bacterium]